MPGADEDIAEETRVVDACWERLRTLPLLEQTWPQGPTLPAREAFLRWAPEVHERLQTKHTLIHRFGVIPIVAVVGLLNSGKSSLTASLLAPANHPRVLRGPGQRAGSQRFTLWIPHTWQEDDSFFEKLLELLRRVFAVEPEFLSQDQPTAYAQQNDPTRLDCPLIATDDALTTHRLALLDCPDIQRAQSAPHASRLEMVRRSAEICAAVFVVFARNQIEIRPLREILQAMPDAHRVHLINLIKDEPAEKVARETRNLLDLPEDVPVYGAYDFLSARYLDHTPSWDPNRSRSSQERLQASEPCFFALDTDPGKNTPPSIEPERALAALTKSLTPQAVKSRRMKELLAEFYQDLQEGLRVLESGLATRAATLAEASRRLRDECQGLLIRDGHVQIKMSPEIIHSVEQSLGRTANFYYRWLLLPPRKFFQATGRLIEKGRQFSVLPRQDLREQQAKLEAKWQISSHGKIARGTITPKDIQRLLSLWSGATGDYQPPETWEPQAQAILQRFIEEDKTNLSDAEWDALTGPLWDQIPKRARMRLATSVFLMFGGLLLAFVDGGISLISLHAMDLLGGLGVLASLGVNLQGAKEFEKVLEEKIGLQQVANFHAIVCDVIGVPRETGSEDFPAATVPRKLDPQAYGITQRHWSQFRLIPSGLKELRAYAR